MLFRLLILGLITCILFFLGQGFYQIFIRKANALETEKRFPEHIQENASDETTAASLKTVKMLAIRVGLSFSLLVIVIVAKWYYARH
jgi:hypothetical protein